MTVIADRYAGIVLDLDGVCFRGDVPIPGAAEAVTALRGRGIDLIFATNNSSRTGADVAAHLTALGFAARADEVVTAAVAAAALLAPGTRCLVVGMAGLREALAERGCVEVGEPGQADAVVVGIDTALTYDTLARAARALLAGARFVATNTDRTLPLPDGLAPGTGALLAALTAATGREPEIAGKPEAPLLEAASARMADGPRLMVGDRPETDIEGARRLGWDTALVLTGVTSAEEAARLDPAPTYVLDSVGDLLAPG